MDGDLEERGEARGEGGTQKGLERVEVGREGRKQAALVARLKVGDGEREHVLVQLVADVVQDAVDDGRDARLLCVLGQRADACDGEEGGCGRGERGHVLKGEAVDGAADEGDFGRRGACADDAEQGHVGERRHVGPVAEEGKRARRERRQQTARLLEAVRAVLAADVVDDARLQAAPHLVGGMGLLARVGDRSALDGRQIARRQRGFDALVDEVGRCASHARDERLALVPGVGGGGVGVRVAGELGARGELGAVDDVFRVRVAAVEDDRADRDAEGEACLACARGGQRACGFGSVDEFEAQLRRRAEGGGVAAPRGCPRECQGASGALGRRAGRRLRGRRPARRGDVPSRRRLGSAAADGLTRRRGAVSGRGASASHGRPSCRAEETSPRGLHRAGNRVAAEGRRRTCAARPSSRHSVAGR